MCADLGPDEVANDSSLPLWVKPVGPLPSFTHSGKLLPLWMQGSSWYQAGPEGLSGRIGNTPKATPGCCMLCTLSSCACCCNSCCTGSAVVHMTGGLAGLMGCILVGPRLGRFDSNGTPVDMPGHSATLVVLGTVLLWFGWYGFNPGSTLNVVSLAGKNSAALFETSGRAAVTTTLSGAAGVMTALITTFIRHKAWDLISVCNGALVGFVSITASCAVVEPWAALIAGMIGSLIFDFTCWLWLKLRIDDPLCASPMHGICGMWGVLFAGFFATEKYVGQAYLNGRFGAFMGGGGNLLGCQVIGILVIAAWVCCLTGLLFMVLKFFKLLRISPEEEQAGLDVSKHGGSAYNYDHGLSKPEKAHVSMI